jgi:2'-5' RNA ligase
VPQVSGWLCVVDALRLFAAVDPPDDVCAQLSGSLPPADERLRYVAAKQWHLTLAFYGSVAEPKVETLRAGLERAASRLRPLRLRLAGAGTFPRQSAKARVLWVGLDGDVDELRRLADRCAGAGRRARIAMESRAFRPHLTVARARQGAVDLSGTVEALTSFTSDWWTVDVVRLVHSTLGAKVHHTTVGRFSLERADPRATHQA